MYKGVCLDVDGVLLDSVPPALAIVKYIVEARGETFTRAKEREFRKMAGLRFAEYFKLLFPGSSFEEAVAQWRPVQERIIPGTIPAFPYATEIIQALKSSGHTIILVTNREASNFKEHAGDRCPWLEAADALQTLRKRTPKLHKTHLVTRFAKPDPRALDPALAWLRGRGIEKNEVVFCGDSLADLMAAHGNGIAFVGVLTGTVDTKKHWVSWAQELDIALPPDHVISSVKELPAWLAKY